MIHVDGPRDWFLLIGSAIFVIAMPFAARAYWRNRHNEREIIAFIGNFIYNREPFQRGHVRTGVPLMLLFGMPFFLLMFFLALSDEVFWERSVFGGNVAGLVTLVFLACLTSSAILYWSIMLYNRPKRLVPSDLREEQGILEARRARGRSVGNSAADG